MMKSKREIALEKDIQQAQELLIQMVIELQWIEYSEQQETRVKSLAIGIQQMIDRALATLDYQPVKEGDYTYRD